MEGLMPAELVFFFFGLVLLSSTNVTSHLASISMSVFLWNTLCI